MQLVDAQNKVRFPDRLVYKGGEFYGVLRFCVVGGSVFIKIH